jgi:hypothetical protein
MPPTPAARPTPQASATAAPQASRARPALRERLSADHVLAVLMDEHQRLLARLERLEEILRTDASAPEPRRTLLEELREIAAALLAAEPHHRREEEVLFPALRERGIDGPPAVMLAEHATLRERKQRLHCEVQQALAGEGPSWSPVVRAGLALSSLLREHIHKEDEVLYPLAHRVIADAAQWAEMKRRCDQIGYCCPTHL